MNKIIRLLRYDWPMHFVLLLTNWLPDNVIFLRLRGSMARPFFKTCGKDLRLGRDLTFYNPSKIEIGKHVYIARSNWFSAGSMISIGDEVIFGPHSVIASANHTRQNGSFRYGAGVNKPISIGRGVWIAANCTVTAGSSINGGTLIAANTVVTGEIPANVLFAGNPGKVVSVFS